MPELCHESSVRGRNLSRLMFLAVLLLVAWLPVPLGSNRAWSVALFAFAAALLLSLRLIAAAVSGSKRQRHSHRLTAVGAALLGGWLLLCLLQLVPAPAGWLQAVGAMSHGLYRVAEEAGVAVVFRISVDFAATLKETVTIFAYFALFLLTRMVTTSRRRLRWLCWTILLVGAAEAFGGMAGFVAEHKHPHYAGVTGTYVNRNHFAGLMELTLGLGLGIWVAALAASRGSLKRSLLQRLSGIGPQWLWLVASVALMAGALWMTGSRGGVIAFLAAVLGISVGQLLISRGDRRELSGLPLVLLCGIVVTIGLGAGALPEKLTKEGFSSNRGQLRQTGMVAVAQSPWVGSGAGTFRWVFPLVRDDKVGNAFYEHLHNDYLEWAVEFGVIAGALPVLAIAMLWLRIWLGLSRRRDPFLRGVMLGALFGTTSLLIHGLVDFNLHIPANAAYFFVLLAAGGVAADFSSGGDAVTGTGYPL